MDRGLVLGLVLAAGCSARLKDNPTTDAPVQHDSPVHVDSSIDSATDAYVFGAWSAPNGVPGASDSTLNIDDETLNSQQTELYFGIIDPGLAGSPKQLWMMNRATAADPWGSPVRLDASFNVGGTTPPTEESPRFSPDDLKIYFGRGGDIYYATRSAIGQPWTTPVQLPTVSTANYEKWFAVCNGNYYLVARNSGSGTPVRLYEGQLGAGSDTLSALSGTTGNDIGSFLSADCTTAYWASNRSGTTQIYTSTRTAPGASWQPTTMLDTEFGTSTDNEDPWLSPDGRTFYFASTRYGGTNVNKGVFYSTR
jgi:hypothetical protein